MTNKTIRNITISALLMGLGIIFERIIVINIPPLIRFGIGSIPVIIASIIIGPIYGAFIGLGIDVFGFFVFDTSGYSYTPFVTISFILMGILPYFLLKLSKFMRYKKNPFPITYIILSVIWAFMLVYLLTASTIKISGTIYPITLQWKVLIPLISLIVFVGFSIFIYYLNRRFQKRIMFYPDCPSPHESAFIIIVLEIIVHIVWGSIWKGIFFQINPLVVFFMQSVIFIITFPLKTFVLYTTLYNYHRYIDKARSDYVE